MNRKIQYKGYIEWCGAHYLKFKIEDTNYVYAMSFPSACKKIDALARMKGCTWKALNRAKKQATTWFRVNPEWPSKPESDV